MKEILLTITTIAGLFFGKEYWAHKKLKLEDERKDAEILSLKKENAKLKRRIKKLESY